MINNNELLILIILVVVFYQICMKPKQCSKEHFKVCQDVDELNENIYSLRNGLGMINNHKHFKEEKKPNSKNDSAEDNEEINAIIDLLEVMSNDNQLNVEFD